MTDGAPCPLELDDLLAYLLDHSPAPGEPDAFTADELDAIEDHLFECDACARRLDALDALQGAVGGAVRSAELGGNVSRAFLDRAARDGLSVREYRIPEGGTVACTAGPEDLVLVRLAARAREEDDPLRLQVTFENLELGESTEIPPREVLADRHLGEVMLVFPGDTVRAYPRSRWTMRLADGSTYVMDHTPNPTGTPPEE